MVGYWNGLKRLKVGDEIVIDLNRSPRRDQKIHDPASEYRRGTVTKVTKTQVTVDYGHQTGRFMKSNGQKFGTGDSWRGTRIGGTWDSIDAGRRLMTWADVTKAELQYLDQTRREEALSQLDGAVAMTQKRKSDYRTPVVSTEQILMATRVLKGEIEPIVADERTNIYNRLHAVANLLSDEDDYCVDEIAQVLDILIPM